MAGGWFGLLELANRWLTSDNLPPLLDIDTSGNGRRGLAVDQPPVGGTHYPFVRSSAEIPRLVGDLVLVIVDDDDLTLPYHLDWVAGLGTLPYVLDTHPDYIDWRNQSLGDWALTSTAAQAAYTNAGTTPPVTRTHKADVGIVDSNGATVFDTTTANSYSSWDWSDHYRIHEWRSDDKILKLVQYISAPIYDAPGQYPVYFEPTSAQIDDRAVRIVPQGVTSISTKAVGSLQEHPSGAFVLYANYNTKLEVSDQTIAISSFAGAGVGAYPLSGESEPITYITSVAGVTPDSDGNVNIVGQNCYKNTLGSITRIADPSFSDTVDVGISTGAVTWEPIIILQNHCSPCCECSDYVKVYESLRLLVDRLNDLTTAGEKLKVLYNQVVTRFLDVKEAKEARPLRVRTRVKEGDQLTVAAGVANYESSCIRNVVLLFEFGFWDADNVYRSSSDLEFLEIVDNTAFRTGNTLPTKTLNWGGSDADNSGWRTTYSDERYAISGEWPRFWAHFDGIDPGKVGTVVFDIKFTGVLDTNKISLRVSAFASDTLRTASSSSTPIPGVPWSSNPDEEGEALRIGTSPEYIYLSLLHD